MFAHTQTDTMNARARVHTEFAYQFTGREIPERGLVQHALEREILGAQKAEVLQCMRQPVVRQALSWDDNV